MTNLIVLREKEEFLRGYTPAYSSIMPLFIGNSQKYSLDVGKLVFKRTEAIGDLETKFFDPKQTEIHQIAVGETKKEYKKYVHAAQYTQSAFQTNDDFDAVKTQVMDVHNKQSDKMFVVGDGTSDATVKNNGLLFSLDSNYTKNNAGSLATTATRLDDLYSLITAENEKASALDGQKMIMLYGAQTIATANRLFTNVSKPFLSVLGEAIDTPVAKLPAGLTPAGQEGFLIINMSQSKLHYTTLPMVLDEGVNAEKMYAWTNFVIASSMLEVMAKDGIIRNPLVYV